MDITKRGPRPHTPHPIIPRVRVQLESSKVTITSSVTGVHEDRGASPRLGPTGFPRVRLASSLAGTWVVGNATGIKSTSVRKRSRTPPKCIRFGKAHCLPSVPSVLCSLALVGRYQKPKLAAHPCSPSLLQPWQNAQPHAT